MINIAPGWYGGKLANIISNDIETDTMQDGILVGGLGFLFEDFETNQEIWLHGRDHSHLRFYLWQEGRGVSSGKQEDQHQMEIPNTLQEC